MAIPLPDKSKSSNNSSNTFLGVRPGTITKKTVKKKAEKDTKAAAARKAVVDYELKRRTKQAKSTQKKIKEATQLAVSPQAKMARARKSASAINNAAVVQSVATNIGQYGRTGTMANNALNNLLPRADDYEALAKFNAKRDTATDYTSQQYYAKHGLDQTTHDYFIAQGNKWMTDSDTINGWIFSGLDKGYLTEDEYKIASDKQGEYEEYMRKYLRSVNTYDPNDDRYKVEQQFTEDAPLPPWIPPTVMNIKMWRYYVTYAHDVVQATADSYVEHDSEIKEQIKNPYKSAFSSNRSEDDIDSFFDLLIAPGDERTTINNIGTYFKEYYLNPIKRGKFLTVAGNTVWNLMDTMDFAARGARAFAAGDTVLGGANRSFKGQQEYWATIPGYDVNQSKLLQEKFMKNGGFELLKLDHPDSFTGHVTGNRDELIKQLNKAFNGQDWGAVYWALTKSDYFNRGALDDLKQGVENVKQAYSDPSASFEADTDSTAANILIESALDPGMVLGGLSKNLVNGTVRSAADNAIESGFRAILRDSDEAKVLLKDKKVSRAIKQFIDSNEGRNIIFRDSKKFNEDVEILMKRLDDTGLFSTDAAKETFKRTVTAHLLGKNTNVNGKLIASTDWARNAIDSKTFKAAYYMDKAIDGIDSAIVKSSFAAPWTLVKGIKGGKRIVMSMDSVGKFVAGKRLKAGEAARAVRDELTGAVDVTRARKLILKAQAGEVDIRSAQRALREVSFEYDKLAVNINSWISKVVSGELTDEEVMKLVSDAVYGFSNGKYTRVADLAAEVASQDVRYAQDIQNAYVRLDKQFDRLNDVIARKSDAAKIGFLDKVSKIDNVDELRSLFRANMDNATIMGLRSEVVDKSAIKGLTDADIDRIVSEVQNGLFTEKDVTAHEIRQAISVVESASDRMIERTISVAEFKSILDSEFSDLVDDVLHMSEDAERKIEYPKQLRAIIDPDKAVSNFSLDYLKHTVDSTINSITFRTLQDQLAKAADTSARLFVDERIATLLRLRDRIYGLDVVSLKDVETITRLHIDRMAMFQNFVNSPAIKKLFNETYDAIVSPVIDSFISKHIQDTDLTSSSLFSDVLRLKELKYGFDRTNSLKSELMSLRGFSDPKLHAVLNGLGNNFGRKYGTLQDVVRTPGVLRRNLEATVRAQFGTSKLSMESMTNMLKSINSDAPSEYFKPYLKELEEDTTGTLKSWLNDISNGNVLSPQSYVDKQMLSAILMDPSIVDDYNALAKNGKSPIFFHISTSGLSSELNDITAVSYRKWVPIDLQEGEQLSLSKIKAAFEAAETDTFKRGLSDAEIDAISENNLRHMADWKGMSSSQIRAEYKKVFGASKENPSESEDQLLEKVCSFINSESMQGTKRVIPTLVVHDLDGFNIPFFNRKVAEASRYASDDSKVYDYTRNILNRVQDNSLNTYDRLASRVKDNSFTSDELDQVVKILEDYIDDISRYAGNNYNMFDFSEYERTFQNVISEAQEQVRIAERTYEGSDLFELGNSISNALSEYKGYADDLSNYRSTLQQVSNLNLYPKQLAFTSSDLGDNVVYTALKAAGRDTINVESRIYVKDVLSYFNIGDEDSGLNVSFDALDRMHNLSQYIIRNRDNAVVAGAEDFLLPYKRALDTFINAIATTAELEGAYSSTELEFLRSLKVPDTAVEAYLMAQKLYDDYVKFWLSDDSLTSFSRSTADIDALRMRIKSLTQTIDNVKYHLSNAEQLRIDEFRKKLFQETLYETYDLRHEAYSFLYEEACDHMNNYRTKILSEMLAGDAGLADIPVSKDLLNLFDGANRPDIFKAAAKADYSKTIYSYKDGVLREGLDMASKLSEANSNIRSNIRQLESIDRYFQNAGLKHKSDMATAMLYSKSKQLFDILEGSDLPARESFQKFLRKASDIQRLKLQQYALDSLRVNDRLDRTRLLQELVYNNFNHIVFNSHAYTSAELSDLKRFVKDLQKSGDDFLSLYEDRSTGNIFVYLNYKGEIATDGTKNFLNNVEIPQPKRNAIGFADFDELKELIDDIDDIDDFREVYNQLISCWEDTRVLSEGRINGTSGKVVSRKQAEEYLATIPSEMNDMLSPKGMLVSDMTRGIVYDPGFVRNEDSDILLDYLETLNRQADAAKEDAVLINEVFTGSGPVKFNELSEHFTDDELMEYFGNSSDYVVVTLTENANTKTGLQVQRLKIDNLASLRAAKELPYTTILPYDMYYEIANTMNRSQNDSVYRKLLGKYLLVYKAFALGTKPGTWIRNYVDATTKAALDNGEDLLQGTASLVSYHGKAVRDINTYFKIMKTDPSLLTKANWDMVQKVFKTDMPYEDFEMLKGVVDSNRFTSADKYFINKTAGRRGGLNVISGDNIGLRNLDEKDITEAFNKYLAKEPNLPFTKDEFLDIYFNRVEITPEQADLYEDMMRRLSLNLRSADKTNIFDKTINNLFKPFALTENITRYSQSLYLRDMGMSGNQTLRHIHQTQFFNAPTWGTFNKLETIMPFITFKYNNIMFWIRMMDENPRYFRYFEEVYGNIADSTIEDMLDQSREVDYESDSMFQTGGIPAGVNDTYFNIGNSFLSAMNDFYGITGNFNQLNPLLRETLRYSAYALGLNSKEFLSEIDLDVSDEDPEKNMIKMLPGYSFGNSAVRFFKNIPGTCTSDGGPTMDTLFSTLNFMGVLGIRKNYSNARASDFNAWLEELEAQGKWYDRNTGKIVDISLKNDYGANDPNISFEDVEAYMMLHFGKMWDANQHKFVVAEDFVPGNFNVEFDFENDPMAWDKLQAWMRLKGKVYDYNLKKFVPEAELSPGGLNDPNISWEKKCQLMEEKFGLKWDANQGAFVTADKYIAGGLNDTKSFLEVMGLREALYGETYNKETHKFEQTGEPSIVTIGDSKEYNKYDEYFSRLAIPRLKSVFTEKFTLNSEGFLVTSDGKYILTKNADYNEKVFSKFRNTYAYSGRGRRYNSFKRYSWSKFTRFDKQPYRGRTLPSHYYTGYGWNDKDGYYRWQFNFNYQYHNPQPGRKLHRLLSPRITYPYGGGYNKFSFYTR